METREQQITSLLSSKLNPEKLEVVDFSAEHAGHAEARKSGGGHFSVYVVSNAFSGQNRIQRHRLINEALNPLFDSGDIHALTIKAFCPGEE